MQMPLPIWKSIHRVLLIGLFTIAHAAEIQTHPEQTPQLQEIAAVHSHRSLPPQEMASTELNENLQDSSTAEEPEPTKTFPTDNQVFDFFTAILRMDFIEAKNWLDQGMDVNITLPPSPPKEFLQLIKEPRMTYYVTRDEDVTALMMAAGMALAPAVDFLLNNGADRWKKTKRNKTYALWLASRTGDVELMRKLMNLDPHEEWNQLTINVSITNQEMTMRKNGEVIFESPISSGRKDKPTPTGKFLVTDKHAQWKSTIYNVSMPHYVRLSCSDFGFHAGNLPGYPASGGCIRLPAAKAKEVFSITPIGTLVIIEP